MLAKYKKTALTTGMSLLMMGAATTCMAQEASSASAATADPYGTLRITLLIVALVLVMAIVGLANIVRVTAMMHLNKQRKKDGKTAIKAFSIIILLIASPLLSLAQEAEEAVAPASTGLGLPTDIYAFLGVIAMELIVIFALIRFINGFIRDAKPSSELAVDAVPKLNFFQKMLRPQSIAVQQKLDLNHDYDGIRELDNDIPRWWSLAFVGTFVFSIIYLFRMFGSETMPLQLEELAVANAKADARKLEYLKNSADNVDENSVVMLGVEDIAQGRELFTKNCVACHGDRAQGNVVGPNLTDDAWLHKGGVHDIFYSIKYGWEEKGMKSWKNDFSPKQIAQLSSFVKSIANTHVEGGKEAQGDIYVDMAAISLADSAVNIKPVESQPEKGSE